MQHHMEIMCMQKAQAEQHIFIAMQIYLAVVHQNAEVMDFM